MSYERYAHALIYMLAWRNTGSRKGPTEDVKYEGWGAHWFGTHESAITVILLELLRCYSDRVTENKKVDSNWSVLSMIWVGNTNEKKIIKNQILQLLPMFMSYSTTCCIICYWFWTPYEYGLISINTCVGIYEVRLFVTYSVASIT